MKLRAGVALDICVYICYTYYVSQDTKYSSFSYPYSIYKHTLRGVYMQTNTGSYVSKKTNQDVQYSYEYEVLTSQEAIDLDTAYAGAAKLVQRMLKVDANNLAREKAKTANGDSTRKPLTEAEKATRKAERGANAQILAMLKSKGLSLKDIESL